MKANRLLVAAMLAGAMAAPINAPAEEKLRVEGNLPSLRGATGWLNSPPIAAESLRGKVVLVDFWTC